ncbi:MAG: Ig-like domain-containing protein [Pirellulales bacterium]
MKLARLIDRIRKVVNQNHRTGRNRRRIGAALEVLEPRHLLAAFSFSTDVEFELGVLANVNHAPGVNQLQLNQAGLPGTWTIVQDACAPNIAWDRIDWNTEAQAALPPGAAINVEARAANSLSALANQSFVAVNNDAELALSGRFIEVRATLQSGLDNASPVLSDLTIFADTIDLDLLESNDTLASATVLGSQAEITLNDLTLHTPVCGPDIEVPLEIPVPDSDFFKVTAHDTGNLILRAHLEHDLGNINLRVRDMLGNIVADSLSLSDLEQVIIPVVAQEMYFIQVFGATADVSGVYDLEIENFAAPVPIAIILDPDSDTGMMDNDNVTSDTSATVLVLADLADFAAMGIGILSPAEVVAGQSGAAIEVFSGGVSRGFATPVAGSGNTEFSFTFAPGALREGLNLVTAAVRVFDGTATGRTELSIPLTVRLDTTLPSGSAPDLLTASDTGMFNNDNVTKINAPAFGGTGERNAKVRIFADGELVGAGVVNSNRTWEITSEPLADGAYDITLEYEDLAGNISTSTQLELDPLPIVIDTTAPNHPALDLFESSDTGRHNQDNVTYLRTVNLGVTFGNGENVPGTTAADPANQRKYRIYDLFEGESLQADSSGLLLPFDYAIATVTFSTGDGIGAGLSANDGLHPLKLVSEDRAGNLSHEFILNVTLDTVAPSAPSVALDPDSDSSIINQPDTLVDMITSDSTPSFVGIAEANAIVRVLATGGVVPDDGGPKEGGKGNGNGEGKPAEAQIGLTVAIPLDGNQAFPAGSWSVYSHFDLNDPVVGYPHDGLRLIIVSAEDLAGNLSTLSTKEIFIDTRGPQVQRVFIPGAADYDLFGSKPGALVPTPLIDRLTIKFTDRPDRLEQFLYPAVNEDLATFIGNYQLVCDATGPVLITDITFADMTTPGSGGMGGGRSGAVAIDGGDRDDHGGAGEGGNEDGWLYIEQLVEFAHGGALNGAPNDVLVIGATGGPALAAIQSVTSVLGMNMTVVTGVDITTVTFSNYRLMYVPSNVSNTTGGVSDADLALLTARKADVQSFVNSGGSLVALTEEDALDPYGWLELPDRFQINGFGGGGISEPLFKTAAAIDAGITISDQELSNGAPYHNEFIGPPGFNNLEPWVLDESGRIITLGLPAGSGGIGTGMVMTEVTLIFDRPLPDDRCTLTIRDSISDDAGNALDGESQAGSPFTDPTLIFVSGDGQPGGDFVGRFTIDSRPEIGVWSAGSVYVDTNGNFQWDPTNNDQVNRDITYVLGYTSDNVFAGNFVGAATGVADGFDKLAAYGFAGGAYRWMIDTSNDGVPDITQIDPAAVNGVPFSGDFDGNLANGDEVGLFTGTRFWLDRNHDFKVDFSLTTELRGNPIAGDFNGDGFDDLATWSNDKFFFDLYEPAAGGWNGVTNLSFGFGFPGVLERPVAGDLNQDGFDDLGLWVPNRSGVTPERDAEWYFLVSVDPETDESVSLFERIETNPTSGLPVINFTPVPFGHDLVAQFGDEFALPIFGNFDPPVTTPSSTPEPVELVHAMASSSTWGDGFESHADHADGLGYGAPLSQNETVQLAWESIDEIRLQFSGDLPLSIGDLVVRGANQALYPIESLVIDPVMHTAVWRLAQPILADKVLVELTSEGLAESIRLRMNVLPGDVNRDGIVNRADLLSGMRTFLSQRGTAIAARHDINGDGVTNLMDIVNIRNRQGRALPDGEPGGPSPSVDVPLPGLVAVDRAATVDRAFAEPEPLVVTRVLRARRGHAAVRRAE